MSQHRITATHQRGRPKKHLGFPKGNIYWQRRYHHTSQAQSEAQISHSLTADEPQISHGLTADEPDEPTVPTVTPPICRYKRYTKDFQQLLPSDGCLGNITVLRPTADACTKLDDYRQACEEDNTSIIGNRLINLQMMEKLITVTHAEHRETSPLCAGDFFFPADHETARGLGVKAALKCRLCSYIGEPLPLYEEQRKDEPAPGPKAVKMNIQLGHFLGKSPVSTSDIQLLFAALDCKPPAASTLQRLVNSAVPEWCEANQKVMNNNYEQLTEVLKVKGKSSFIAQQDTSYNNPPKGQVFSQPGTQSFSPMIECETTKQLLVSCACINKLCKTGDLLAQNHIRPCPNHPNCTASFKGDRFEAMDKSEKQAGQENYERLKSKPLKLSGLICDGSSKAADGMRASGANVEKLECTLHLSRGMKRRIFKLNLSTELTGKDQGTRTYFLTTLGNVLVRRCMNEMHRARSKFGEESEEMMAFIQKARRNVLRCLEGDHSRCSKASLVCRAANREKRKRELPHGKYLHLQAADRAKLQSAIDYKLSEKAAKSQRHCLTTNRAESMHLRVFKVMPKTKTCSRSFQGRAHCALHSDSVGVGNSVITLNEQTKSELSRGGKAIKCLERLQRRQQYYKQRRKTVAFKVRRNQLLYRALSNKRLCKLKTVNAQGEMCDDHAYYSAEGHGR